MFLPCSWFAVYFWCTLAYVLKELINLNLKCEDDGKRYLKVKIDARDTKR